MKQSNRAWWLLVPIGLLIMPLGGPSAVPRQRIKTAIRNKIAGHAVRGVLAQKNTGLDLADLSAVLEDRNGEFWMAADSTLRRCNQDQKNWRAYNFKGSDVVQVSGLNQTADGTLWISGRGNPLGFTGFVGAFDGTTWRNLAQEIDVHPDSPVQKDDLKHFNLAFPGREQREWLVFGQLNSRPYMLAYDGLRWGARIDLPTSFVEVFSGFEDSQGCIWLSAGDIWRFNKATSEWQSYEKPGDYGSARIFEDREGRIWFAYSFGYLEAYDRRTDQWTRFSVSDHLPARAKRPNKVWESTGHVLPAFFPVLAVYQDVQGQMLFATNSGLITLGRTSDSWGFFDTENSALPGDRISTVFENKAGRIWLGTSEGIVILDQ